MQLFYYAATEGNFGDDLNKWIWHRLIPEVEQVAPDVRLCGIGTILAPWMPRDGSWVICGSGTGYGAPALDLTSDRVSVRWVRGPLTAKVLGLDPDAAVTDGAVLLADLPEFASLPASERQGVIFIPHKSALIAGNWEAVCRKAGVRFVDPRHSTEIVLDAIRRASLVLADSMHAAIVADTFRVPWIPVRTSPEINEFKWLDWALSMDVPYDPIALPYSSYAEMWRGHRLAAATVPSGEGDRVAAAIEHFELLSRQADHPAHSVHGSRLLRWPTRVLRKALRGRRIESGLTDRAAAALKALATRPGNLSRDAVFRQRLEEANRRVATIASEARRLAASDRAIPRPLSR